MRKPRALALAFAVQAGLLAAALVVALDLYAHKRDDGLAGMNMRGYRGAVAHQKGPHEIRIVVVGGTRAFGLGMPASWTIATVLRQQVMLTTDRPGGEVRPVVPITLAWPGALPDSYPATLDRFAGLRPDYICIYDDLGVGGAPLPEEISGVYARTGYWPILPLALEEKGMAWRFGSVSAGYRGGGAASSPAWPLRAAGAVLQAAGAGLSRLDRSLAKRAAPHGTDDPGRYSAQMLDAVDAALRLARGVVVAVPPAESSRQAMNRAALLPRLAAKREGAPRLRVVDLAEVAPLTDPSERLADGWSYGGDAIAAAARAMTPAVLDLILR